MGEVIDAAMMGKQSEPFAIVLGEAADIEIEKARREFHSVLRRHRKMTDIAALQSCSLVFSDW